MEGCSSLLTHFCLDTSLKLPKWVTDRTPQQNHPQLSKILAMEMFSCVPPLRSLNISNQGRILHHLPASASSLMSPAQPWRQQLDEKPAAVEGQQRPQQMESCQPSKRLKNHLAQDREVENGRWRGVWGRGCPPGLRLNSFNIIQRSNYVRNVLNDLKPVERTVWRQQPSDCNASILTCRKCQTCYSLCCTTKAWNPFTI